MFDPLADQQGGATAEEERPAALVEANDDDADDTEVAGLAADQSGEPEAPRAPASAPPPEPPKSEPAPASASEAAASTPEAAIPGPAESSAAAEPSADAPAAVVRPVSAHSVMDAVTAAQTPAELTEALKPVQDWEYAEEQQAGIKRSWQYVPDQEVYAGFFVSSINEWRVSQPRVLILSKTAYYRVSYNPKNGKVDHYHKTPLQQLRVLEKTPTGLKVFLTEQDGYSGPKKWMGSLAGAIGVKKNTPNEFQHAREYLPALAAEEPASDVIVDVIAAAFAKAAALLKDAQPELAFTPPNIITTEQRYQILADRREAERLAAEKKEREAAEEELRQAMDAAKESRDAAGLVKPIRRAKRAVEADAALLDAADDLKTQLEAEKRERELQERLEAERVEREAATAELAAAIAAARTSREPSGLAKPIRRSRKAVGVSDELIHEAEALKAEIEAEIKADKARLAAEAAEKKAAEKKAAEAAAAEKKAAEAEAAAQAKAAAADDASAD